MPLPTATVLGILGDNLARRGSVLPLSKRTATRWAEGLDLPKGGDTVIYTGHLYQLIPAIDLMAGLLARFEESWVTRLFGLGRFVNRFISLTFFIQLLVPRRKRAEYNAMLHAIARLLKDGGVSFGYLYEDDLYSGTLAYDEGLDEAFAPHARRVAEAFRRHGVRRVITVDPHTTHMLQEVYPRFVPGFKLEVVSYLDVLAEAGGGLRARRDGQVVIHDSCVYARYVGVIESPRTLLRRAGVPFAEPELTGAATHCCGGPVEVLFPGEAHRIALERVAQLTKVGRRITTMCPICLVNLRKAAGDEAEILDISQVLAGANDGR
ncbi:MAG: (Fe-S)-binding protein [Acidimicrobiia bacterium]|nr:(Fe-S)-binding protein [Acidimicrobiia bacterium]